MPAISFNAKRQVVVDNDTDYGGNISSCLGLKAYKSTPADAKRGEFAFGDKIFKHTGIAGGIAPFQFIYTDADQTGRYWTGGDSGLYKIASLSSAFVADAISGTPTSINGDMAVFGRASSYDRLVVPNSTDLWMLNNGTWTQNWWTGATHLNQSALSGATIHMTVFQQLSQLYIGDGNAVHMVGANATAADVVTNIVVLPADHVIDWMRSSAQRVYFGVHTKLQNTSAGVWEYDPVNQTAWFVSYNIPGGTDAGCPVIYKNLLYVLCQDARLRYFDGSGFADVGDSPASKYNTNITYHRNGGVANGERLYFLLGGSSFPSYAPGIYVYDFKDKNFYHSMPYVITGTDAAQLTSNAVGGLYTNGTDYLAGIYDASPTSSLKSVYSTVNRSSLTDTVRCQVVLPKTVVDSFVTNYIAASVKRSTYSTGDIYLKYRYREYSKGTPDGSTSITVTWTTDTSFTSTADLSEVLAGHEVTVLSGVYAGQTDHISAISLAGGTYTVTLVTGFSAIASATPVMILPFFSAGAVPTTSKDYGQIGLISGKNSSDWVQLKLEVRDKTCTVKDVVLHLDTNVPYKP